MVVASVRWWLPRHWQRLKCGEEVLIPPPRLAGCRERGKAIEQRGQHLRRLEPCQGVAKAVVRAEPERELSVVAAMDVKAFRLAELRRIAVGGCQCHHDGL